MCVKYKVVSVCYMFGLLSITASCTSPFFVLLIYTNIYYCTQKSQKAGGSKPVRLFAKQNCFFKYIPLQTFLVIRVHASASKYLIGDRLEALLIWNQTVGGLFEFAWIVFVLYRYVVKFWILLCCCMVSDIMNWEREKDCFLKTKDFAELVMESSTNYLMCLFGLRCVFSTHNKWAVWNCCCKCFCSFICKTLFITVVCPLVLSFLGYSLMWKKIQN